MNFPRSVGWRVRGWVFVVLMSVVGGGWEAPVQAAEDGPDLVFSGLSTDDGLSQSSVFALAEDRQGFLWLGTEDGLNRWDGGGFRVFRGGGREDPEALHGRFVRAIVEDSAGFLWLGTEGGGLARFDPRTETFRNFHPVEGDPESLSEDLVLALTLDSRGDLWIGTRSRGIQRLRRAAEVGERAVFESFEAEPGDSCGLGARDVYRILEDRRRRLWVATGKGLFRWVEEASCFEALGGGGLAGQRLTSVMEDRRGDLWVSARGGLYRLDGERLVITESFLEGEVVEAVLEDRDGVLWVGTEAGGLVRWSPTSGRIIRYRSRAFDSGSLATDVVRSLHEDRSGTLWVGLEQGGVAYLPRLRRHFHSWRSLRTGDGLEQLKSVFALEVTGDGTIWIGTRERGLFALDADTGGARHWGAGAGQPDALDSSRISALASDGDDGLLVGTVEGGVYRLHRGARRMARLGGEPGRSVRALVPDGTGGLWFATWRGGLRHLDAAGTERVFRHDPEDASSLSDDVVLALEPEWAGAGAGSGGQARGTVAALWAGTWNGGLVRFDVATGRARSWRHDAEDPSSLSSDRVAAVLRDRRGRVWVGSAEGLDRLSADGERFETVEPFRGMAVFGLLEDGAGHLWASSGRGLWHYDPESGEVRQYRARHGLQGDEYNLGATARGLNGELLFGGVGGFDIFRPHPRGSGGIGAPFFPQEPPPVVLTGLSTGARTFGAGELQQRMTAGEVLELEPEERTLSVTFAALSFADPDHQRFTYRLVDGGRRGHFKLSAEEGGGWVDAGNQRQARFARLEPGRHRLEVRAASGAGVWNRQGAQLEFYARPSFWERVTVQISAGVLLLAFLVTGITAIFRRRLQRAEREREEAIEVRRRLLAAREQERLRLAQDLHDGPLQELHALQLAASRGTAALGSLRQDLGGLVTELRTVCTRLRSPVLQLFGLEAAIRDHAAELQREHPEVDIHLDLRLGPPKSGDDLDEERRLALFRVFREAVQNALRHGGASTVRVGLEAVDDPVAGAAVALTVEDDGRGFQVPRRWIELARRGHLGILGMDERVDALGGRLEVWAQPGEGTRVTAIMPRRDRRFRAARGARRSHGG
ncbi:MAG: two-component regulator propeller domain-containing protein [Acidobacteriota bacterium]|nr:two-component regulator propeller domain-containing protein [Acidobacteriota bacterium]